MLVDACRVVKLDNKHVLTGGKDDLFHFGLDTASHDLRRMFSDVKVRYESRSFIFVSLHLHVIAFSS